MEKNDLSGVVVVNKHGGVTSHRIISILRRKYNTRKVGHTGTLDPMATGVLPVLIGRAVKACDFVMAEKKEYTAEMQLGITTDTEDTTGTVLSRSDALPTDAEVLAAARGFVGEILQVPPMYSAIKKDGQKLLDLAREGIDVAREARAVTIERLDVTPLGGGKYRLLVTCSKGTYIRTLCADIGRALGCGAAMSALCRTATGPFTLENAKTIDELDAMTDEELAALVLPVEKLFDSYPAVHLPPFFARLARSGAEIYQKKIRTSYPVGTHLALYDGELFFGVGEVRTYEEETAIKTIKLFVL